MGLKRERTRPSVRSRRSNLSRNAFLYAGLIFLLVACGSSTDTNPDDPAAAPTDLADTEPEATEDAGLGENNDLVSAAEAEGSVTWYTGIYDLGTAEAVAELFEETHGIPVTVFREGSGTIHQRYKQEAESGVHEADVVSLSADSLLLDLKESDLLAQYTPPNASNLLPDFQDYDPDGYFHTSGALYVVIAYNTELVPESEAPSTWQEFAGDEWSGQIAMPHPTASGSIGMWAVQMYMDYGEDYFSQLASIDPFIGGSGNDPIPRVAGGERMLGLTGDFSACIEAQNGSPIANIFPDDGAIAVQTGTGIAADAPNPNAARLFADFLMSREVSELYGTERCLAPIRDDVQPGPGVPNPADIEAVRPTQEEMDEHYEDVIELFRREFGV